MAYGFMARSATSCEAPRLDFSSTERTRGLRRKLVFVWENLGPTHYDRLRAVEADPAFAVAAIEFFAASTVHDGDSGGHPGLRRITLYPDASRPRRALWWRLLRAIWRERPDAVFLCHYERLPVFLTALALRLCGRRVYTMIDSKFDDKPRSIQRELVKTLAMAPYCGALVGSRRSAAYVRFLGMAARPVAEGFDCLDVAHLQGLSARPRGAVAHGLRHFLIVARLVPEKNLQLALHAFARWRAVAVHPRRLRIIGAGPADIALRNLAAELGIAGQVDFVGTQGRVAVAEAMRDALCLLLPSKQETFGFVVVEALAQGLPVLVSGNAGAVDGLIDNGVNGWIIDPCRPAVLIAAMARLDADGAAWAAASAVALAAAPRGDVRHFVRGVAALAGRG